MTTLLDRIFARGGIKARFQPVADAAHGPMRCCYLEGLVSGPTGTNVESAGVLFSYIRRKRESARMDRLCISTILAAARGFSPDMVIGLNVNAATLVTDRGFPEYLRCTAAQNGLSVSRLVIEVVEDTLPNDVVAFRAAVAVLRGFGARIALDDVGRAHSNYRMMLETRPDFFKIDRYFVSGVHADPLKQEVLRSIAGLARSFGARVVAEGIERPEELQTVRRLGIDLVQGYLVTPHFMGASAIAAERLDTCTETRRIRC